mmetsp:Transcript_103289/g.318702  ORF Transcript_103289/g.318702 Transcript_103289/m.318702 type:complete len:229 (+) Transcript_103289:825-1511(+)
MSTLSSGICPSRAAVATATSTCDVSPLHRGSNATARTASLLSLVQFSHERVISLRQPGFRKVRTPMRMLPSRNPTLGAGWYASRPRTAINGPEVLALAGAADPAETRAPGNTSITGPYPLTHTVWLSVFGLPAAGASANLQCGTSKSRNSRKLFCTGEGCAAQLPPAEKAQGLHSSGCSTIMTCSLEVFTRSQAPGSRRKTGEESRPDPGGGGATGGGIGSSRRGCWT